MNYLSFTDLSDSPQVLGRRRILTTGPEHPYVGHFWPPGHIIGYEHTFIATLVDFLDALQKKERFRPDFADALQTQQLLAAVVQSSSRRGWIDVGDAAFVAATS